MRILLINHFPMQGSGSGIYTLNIAKELIKKGHKVAVIDIDNQPDKNKYPFKLYTIKANKDIPFNFPCFTTHPRSNLTYYDLTEKQIKQYIDAYIKKTQQVIKEFAPDIIHAQHLWVAPYVAHKLKIPYIVTAHGTDLMGFSKDKRYHKYALEGANNAHKIITISKQVHQDVLKLYKVPESKLALNPNGFDEDKFKILKVDKNKLLKLFDIHKPHKKIISFVGKLTDFKGIDILIDAIPKINKAFPDTLYIIAGGGQLKDKLHQQAYKLGIDGQIFFIGLQPQENIAQIYNIADVSVVPSRIEPFGLVAIEALACGTPVVATNAGGLPDFINSKVGQLVPMNNPDALAKAIIEELKNKTKQTKGKYAAKYAKKNFSWGSTLKKVIQLYKQCKK
ncbi:MAG: glycosyltransferase family 4 protein [Candidatus Woesearchaeota archaeon]